MDVLTILKKDHREVKEMFDQLEELGERADAARAKLFAKIDQALTVHVDGEERYFYPVLKERSKARSEERDDVIEGFEEHAIAKQLIKELEGLPPSDESYKAKLSVLREGVLHHIKDEEGKIWPIAREVLDRDEMEEIGEQIEALKSRGASKV